MTIAINLIIHSKINCCRHEFRVRFFKHKRNHFNYNGIEYTANSQPKQLFIAFNDMLQNSAVKLLLSPAEIPSLSLRQKTAVNMFQGGRTLKNCGRYEEDLAIYR